MDWLMGIACCCTNCRWSNPSWYSSAAWAEIVKLAAAFSSRTNPPTLSCRIPPPFFVNSQTFTGGIKMAYEVNGVELETDEEGYLVEPNYGDEVVPMIAEAEGLKM